MRQLLTGFLAAMLAILMISCTSQSTDEVSVTNTQAELEIFETLLRHVYSQDRSDPRSKYQRYFVLIKGENPPEEFLLRFSDLNPGFEKGSAFPTTPQGKAYLWEITDTKWIDKMSVKVLLRHWILGTTEYTLSKKADKWSVVKETPKSIQ